MSNPVQNERSGSIAEGSSASSNYWSETRTSRPSTSQAVRPNSIRISAISSAAPVHSVERSSIESTGAFLAAEGVDIIASLPCYSLKNVEEQRGRGVFDGSIRALQDLNTLGYGQPESELQLDLIYNPVGAFLPPSQTTLETEYREELGPKPNIAKNSGASSGSSSIAYSRSPTCRSNALPTNFIATASTNPTWGFSSIISTPTTSRA